MARGNQNEPADGSKPRRRTDRRVRADAKRSIDALLQAAMAVFATSGVNAPVRQIAEKAGVGIGTIYRHFPRRSDLIVAVFRREVDACADAAGVLASEREPGEALARWIQRYVDFISAKRGLAAALHSGNPAYDSLPGYFQRVLIVNFLLIKITLREPHTFAFDDIYSRDYFHRHWSFVIGH